jgi:hypothetical protein
VSCLYRPRRPAFAEPARPALLQPWTASRSGRSGSVRRQEALPATPLEMQGLFGWRRRCRLRGQILSRSLTGRFPSELNPNCGGRFQNCRPS